MLGTIFTYLCLFAVESYGIMKLYDVSHTYLDNNWEAFHQIHPAHKKWYVLSNYIKSAGLALFAPFCTMVLYDNVFHNDWNNSLVLHLGCMYAVLDFTSILKVPKLAKNTLYHHVAVTVLYLYTLTNGMHVDSFSRLIVVYAVFSTLAFPVNAYLATRVVTTNKLLLKTFSSIAFINYSVCCTLNWSYQVFHLAWKDHFLTEYGIVPIILFAGFIAVVISDDIILMRYLRDHSFFDWLKPDIPAAVEKTVLIIRNSIPTRNVPPPVTTVNPVTDVNPVTSIQLESAKVMDNSPVNSHNSPVDPNLTPVPPQVITEFTNDVDKNTTTTPILQPIPIKQEVATNPHSKTD